MFIKVKNTFIGLHCWPKAPTEVDFLRSHHRHNFIIRTKISVYHNDREIEFFMLQDEIQNIIKEQVENMPLERSCEDIGKVILKALREKYIDREIEIEVSEDDECSAIVNTSDL